jgi:lipooligosaccharide transport system permease protein
MNLPSWRFIRMWQRNRDVFFKLWWSLAPGFMVEPIILLVALGFGFGEFIDIRDGRDYMEFIVPGVVAAYAMTNATFETTYGAFFRMEYRRTYDAILATPLNIEDITTGEIAWGATRSLITSSIILVVAFLFQLLPSPTAVFVPLIAALEGFMFGCIAMVFTSLVPSIYNFNYYFTLFIAPITFFSGAFFPLDNFTEAIQVVGRIVPLTPAVEVIRSLIDGKFYPEILLYIGQMLLVTAVFFSIAQVTMRRRVID